VFCCQFANLLAQGRTYIITHNGVAEDKQFQCFMLSRSAELALTNPTICEDGAKIQYKRSEYIENVLPPTLPGMHAM
jgi:hypothetical protein